VKGFRFALGACVIATFTLALASEDAPPAHVKVMKDLGASVGNLRKNIEVEKNANAILTAMTEVDTFWKARNSATADKSCNDTREGAMAIVKAAQASDQAGVSAGMKQMGAGCKACHDAHREKISETVYKIK